jgi:small conductance mechanosensitive channel
MAPYPTGGTEIMNTEVIWNFLSTQGADFGLKVLGALAA